MSQRDQKWTFIILQSYLDTIGLGHISTMVFCTNVIMCANWCIHAAKELICFCLSPAEWNVNNILFSLKVLQNPIT